MNRKLYSFSTFTIFLLFSVVDVMHGGPSKVFWIGWIAFASMFASAYWAYRRSNVTRRERLWTLVWSYGVSSGLMLASALIFLLPTAFKMNMPIGGFGASLGIATGFGAHAMSHQMSHETQVYDSHIIQLILHACAAGAVIGLIYANMPELSIILGISIVIHKGPAGYITIRDMENPKLTVMLIPSVSVGLAAFISMMIVFPPGVEFIKPIFFGFATGIFLHLSFDFLPRCDQSSEIYKVSQTCCSDEHDHHKLLDRLRLHSVISTFSGIFTVFILWFIFA